MFDASIVLCWLMLGNQQCATAEDLYSPHDTEVQCQKRLVEMQKAITSQLPFVIIISAECKKRGIPA